MIWGKFVSPRRVCSFSLGSVMSTFDSISVSLSSMKSMLMVFKIPSCTNSINSSLFIQIPWMSAILQPSKCNIVIKIQSIWSHAIDRIRSLGSWSQICPLKTAKNPLILLWSNHCLSISHFLAFAFLILPHIIGIYPPTAQCHAYRYQDHIYTLTPHL